MGKHAGTAGLRIVACFFLSFTSCAAVEMKKFPAEIFLVKDEMGGEKNICLGNS
jgi:hypothetical protein